MQYEYKNAVILMFLAVIPTLWITVNYDFRAGGIYLFIAIFVSYVYMNWEKINR
jgi:hypothetical protein